MKYDEINELLIKKSDLERRINSMPYEGTPEIKTIGSKQYLYVRKRKLNKVKSTYVGLYSLDLFNLLVKNNKDIREIKKEIRLIDKKLAELGYEDNELNSKVKLCIDYARKNRNALIYDQAVLEGIATTFPDTEDILENGIIKDAKADDVQKILNLKHAWQFILDEDVLKSPTDYYLTAYIANIINEGFYQNGGRCRNVPVIIGGSKYIPPIPYERDVIDSMKNILSSSIDDESKAIEICLYVMKTQVFNDGNKRTAVVAANHFLISKGIGFLAIDVTKVKEFKKLLVEYYEDIDEVSIKNFLKNCIYRL